MEESVRVQFVCANAEDSERKKQTLQKILEAEDAKFVYVLFHSLIKSLLQLVKDAGANFELLRAMWIDQMTCSTSCPSALTCCSYTFPLVLGLKTPEPLASQTHGMVE